MKMKAVWSGLLLTLGRHFAIGKERSSSIFQIIFIIDHPAVRPHQEDIDSPDLPSSL
jgi:hypothetical protein